MNSTRRLKAQEVIAAIFDSESDNNINDEDVEFGSDKVTPSPHLNLLAKVSVHLIQMQQLNIVLVNLILSQN